MSEANGTLDAAAAPEPVTMMDAPIRLTYSYTPGVAQSKSLRAMTERRILAQRCSECGQVYVPPKGMCARDGIALEGTFEVPDTGVVSAFCIVNIPFAGQAVECPYVSALITFDGADIAIFHLVQEVDPATVTKGMRVEAVWSDEPEPSMQAIRYFRPLEEADRA